MTQFNLLPDVKAQYIKAQRTKGLFISLSVLVGLVALAIFVLLLLFVDVAQKKHLGDINRDIASNSAQLKSNSNLNKILTVQNQDQTLPLLEAQNPVSPRVFSDLAQLTPAQASIASTNVDFGQHQFTITGSADTLATVNKLVDTIKNTTYKDTNNKNTNAFSSVVLSSFGYSSGSTGNKPANYTITFGFDPAIFDTTNSGVLTVPPIITTRSDTAQLTDLFQKSNATSSTGQGQ